MNSWYAPVMSDAQKREEGSRTQQKQSHVISWQDLDLSAAQKFYQRVNN
jgi:hypothetical protein